MLSAIQPQTQVSGPGAASENAAFSSGTDFSTFLKMLTTQMQNQNPLNPVEAADFAVQLATFSGVEQQVHTNQLLARLTERLVAADMANWLGTDVAAGTSLRVGADDIALHLPAPVAGTTRRDIVLTTQAGQEVMRLAVDTEQTQLVLDPRAGGATPLLPGTYRAQVEDFATTDLLQTHVAPQFTRVREVQQGPTGALLVLSSGTLVDPAAIVAIRKP